MLGSTPVLDIMAENKNSCPHWESNPFCPRYSQSTGYAIRITSTIIRLQEMNWFLNLYQFNCELKLTRCSRQLTMPHAAPTATRCLPIQTWFPLANQRCLCTTIQKWTCYKYSLIVDNMASSKHVIYTDRHTSNWALLKSKQIRHR